MRKSFKAAALFAVAALALAMPAVAQNATDSLPSLQSNTRKATATLFGNDVDNIVDVHGFSDIGAENWFGFITGSPLYVAGNPGTGLLSLGYSRNLSESFYLGLWYQGNVAQVTGGANDRTTRTEILPTYDAYKVLTGTTETTSYNSSWLNSSNQIEVLLGLGKMGIKVGFFESLYGNAQDGNTARDIVKTDDKSGLVHYEGTIDEFYEKGGYIKPYLGWGISLNDKLFPYLDLGLEVYNEAKVDNHSDYFETNKKKVDKVSTVGEGFNNGYVKPEVTLGVELDIAPKEGKSATKTLGIEYSGGFPIYGNDYEATGLSGDKVKGDVSWNNGYVNRKSEYLDRTVTATDLTLTISEQSGSNHNIVPKLVVKGDIEKLSLGFKATLPVDIWTWSYKGYSERHQITDTKYKTDSRRNTTTTTTTTGYNWEGNGVGSTISLNLAVGAKYQFKDNFTVNAGVSARPLSVTNQQMKGGEGVTASVETVKTTDGLKNTTADTKTVTRQNGYDEATADTVWNGFSGNITGGFTFLFTEKVALDMAAGWSTNSFRINVANVDVLLSFKF